MTKFESDDQLHGLDQENQQKTDEFQAEAQIKSAVLMGVVLGLQVCFIAIVAVVTMVSSHTPRLPSSEANLSVQNNTPRIFDLQIPVAADTYLNKAIPSKNFGNEKNMRLGRSGNMAYNSLLRFSLPDLTDYTIKSVDLLLTPAREWGENSPAVKVLACSSEWDEQTVTVYTTLKCGSLLGFLSAGTGLTGAQVCIPLDPNAFSTGNTSGLWLEALTASSNEEFLTKEAGKGAQLHITVEGLRPPPKIPAIPVSPPPDTSGQTSPLAPETAAAPTPPPVDGHWERIFYESFEEPDVAGDEGEPDPAGWLTFGHPAYQHLVDEDSGLFVTPYGAQGLSSYTGENVDSRRSFSITSQHLLAAKLAGKNRYLLMFNVAAVSDTPAAYYRVELLAIDDAVYPDQMPKLTFEDADCGVTVLAEKTGVNDGSKDMSSSDYLLFEPTASHKNLLGKRLAIRLGMDNGFGAKGGSYRDRPVFDNLSLQVDKSGSGN